MEVSPSSISRGSGRGAGQVSVDTEILREYFDVVGGHGGRGEGAVHSSMPMHE